MGANFTGYFVLSLYGGTVLRISVSVSVSGCISASRQDLLEYSLPPKRDSLRG